MKQPSETLRALACGTVAAGALTVALGVLRIAAGTAWPPELAGDRIAPLLTVDQFQQLLALAGGYNEAKQLGIWSGVAGQLAVGALVGVAYTRSRRPVALLVVAVTTLWTAVAVAFWPILDVSYVGLPEDVARVANLGAHAVAFALFAFALVAIERWSRGRGSRHVERRIRALGRELPRRRVLLGAATAAGLAAVIGVVQRFYADSALWYDGLRYRERQATPITPNDRFYVVTKNVRDPEVARPVWRLSVGGRVARPRTWTFEELRALASVEQETTLMCISNSPGDGLMSNAQWTGVPLARLIGEAAPLPDAVEVVLRGADGYADTIPYAKATEPTTLVAYAMNGEPLPARHGFPARVIVSDLFGEKNVKWVTRIEIVDHDAKGFYESQGWGPSFVVPTHSRIDTPLDGERVPAPGVTVRGVAFAGARGVRRVELSDDGGRSWTPVRIDHAGTDLTWALWSFDWRATPGRHVLVVRATDGTGTIQTSQERPIAPEGATGLHRVTVTVDPV
jgi:DMSO/TMAO reductase YedYZ molybdopterin-dependent catalytic subunit